MIPKFRMWNRITSQLHLVDGLYFDDKEVEYVDDDNVLRFIGFKNIELMQSTGLVDKNGKEIFEGDILRVTAGHSWLEVVSYSQEKAMFVTEEVNREFKVPESPLYDLFNTNIFKLEIIGNIWEEGVLLDNKKTEKN